MSLPPEATETNPARPNHIHINVDSLLQEEEEEEEPMEPAAPTIHPPVEADNIDDQQRPPTPQPHESRIPRTAPKKTPVNQRWEYVPVSEEPAEPVPGPTPTFDDEGRRRNPGRTTRNQQPSRYGDSFLTYTGPNARNAYLATEVVGWALSTGFDKDEPRNVNER
jgi:hypothetical protein